MERLHETRKKKPKETERYREKETEPHGRRLSGGQRPIEIQDRDSRRDKEKVESRE